MVFWHPKGWTLYRTLEAYMRRRLEAAGYVEVKTPQVLDRSLLGEVRPLGEVPRTTCSSARRRRARCWRVKPMNCPGHVQIFNHGQRSYRELPIRMAEFGGLPPLRAAPAPCTASCGCAAFTQDDAHIFCREDQIEAESTTFIDLLELIYADLGWSCTR